MHRIKIKDEWQVFTTLSEAISESIVVTDMQQIIVSVNTTTQEMFGYSREELIGASLNLLIPKTYHSGHIRHVETYFNTLLKRKMAAGRDLYALRKGGVKFPVEVGLNPCRMYGKTYVMALVIDITEQKKVEREIRELNVQLEAKIASRTEALKATVAELKLVNKDLEKEIRKRIAAENRIKTALQQEKELNELKTKFLSLVSHEFKTPLSGILTSATLAGKYTAAEQQDKRDKHLKTIIGKVHHLNGILNDFLSMERLDTGKIIYKYSTFKLSKVINEVVYDANMLLKDGQKINYPDNIDHCTVTQDEKILALILSNLIHNAIKYAPENTAIDLLAECTPEHLSIKVADKGIGIPEKDQKFIFNRYFRAENALLTQGTGIGLNIVKGHVENLGGTIGFVSAENKGTTFTVTLPGQKQERS